jgi:hypothetical protein
MRLYQSLRNNFSEPDGGSTSALVPEGPILASCKIGNKYQQGILTLDPNVRLHSCEKSMECSVVDSKTVWIHPIITRTKFGEEINETGVGGGGGYLYELEIDS